jgi:hypothetical protein
MLVKPVCAPTCVVLHPDFWYSEAEVTSFAQREIYHTNRDMPTLLSKLPTSVTSWARSAPTRPNNWEPDDKHLVQLLAETRAAFADAAAVEANLQAGGEEGATDANLTR